MPRLKVRLKRKPVVRIRPKGYKTIGRARRRKGTMTLRNRDPQQLIAPRYITKVKYCERLTIPSAPIGIANVYIMNANSIYDPDRTGVGHQPMFRDQLALLYSRYRVYKISWRIEFPPIGASTNAATFFTVPKNDSQTLGGLSLGAIKESPHAFSKISNTDSPTIFRGVINLPKLTGQTSAQYKAGLEYQALMSNDPTELMTLQIGAVPFAAANTYTFDLQMWYHVECFDPVTVGQS